MKRYSWQQMMLAVLAPFTDSGEARDELMTYRFSKSEQFKASVSLQLYGVGHSEQDVETILTRYWLTAAEMTDWILAKEEALFENDQERFGEHRFDELQVLAKAIWHEAHADVESEPIPEPEPIKSSNKTINLWHHQPQCVPATTKSKENPTSTDVPLWITTMKHW